MGGRVGRIVGGIVLVGGIAGAEGVIIGVVGFDWFAGEDWISELPCVFGAFGFDCFAFEDWIAVLPWFAFEDWISVLPWFAFEDWISVLPCV